MRRMFVLLAALAMMMGGAVPAVADDHDGIEFIGEVTFPTGHLFEGVEMGGLSGITWDEARGVYHTISDDRSQIAPARFYTITIDVGDGSLDDGDVVFVAQTTLLDAAGRPYAELALDPEGIALSRRGTLYVSSEGDTAALQPPFVNEYSIDGHLLGELFVPPYYLPTEDGSAGIRQNAAFESLTVSPHGLRLTTATEAALFQDGPPADLVMGSDSRVLVYDVRTGRPVAEYVYENEPVTDEPIPADSFKVNGLVELLAVDDRGSYLALERSFSVGVGNNVRLYHVTTRRADNIRRLFSIEALDPRPMTKELVLDLTDLGITLDNLEGLALGPALPDGRTPLIVVSDNNFNPNGALTQFLAFALDL